MEVGEIAIAVYAFLTGLWIGCQVGKQVEIRRMNQIISKAARQSWETDEHWRARIETMKSELKQRDCNVDA